MQWCTIFFGVGNFPFLKIFEREYGREINCHLWGQPNINVKWNITVHIIKQFINFMLHFMVMLFQIYIHLAHPTNGIWRHSLVTKSSITNPKNEYERYVAYINLVQLIETVNVAYIFVYCCKLFQSRDVLKNFLNTAFKVVDKHKKFVIVISNGSGFPFVDVN